MSTLVLGGTGFLGRHTVAALVEEGVATMAGQRRRRGHVASTGSGPVRKVHTDLDDGQSLVAAMVEADVVIHCAAYYPKLTVLRDEAIDLAMGQLENALNAAARAKVRRFVLVSSTATVAKAPGGPSDESHCFAEPPGFGVYHDVKWLMEARALAEDRFEAIVACPAGCLGPQDFRVGTSALLVAMARGMDPPHPDGVVNLVDARDVGRALVALSKVPSPPRRILLSQGHYRLHDLLGQLAERYGVSSPSAPMEDADAIELADAEEERAAATGGRPSIAREIVDLIVHGVPVESRLAESTLGVSWQPLDKTLDVFDAWARRIGLIPRRDRPQQELPS